MHKRPSRIVGAVSLEIAPEATALSMTRCITEDIEAEADAMERRSSCSFGDAVSRISPKRSIMASISDAIAGKGSIFSKHSERAG